MFSPGTKFARHVETAPGTVALGIVTPGGEHVIWHDIVDLHPGEAHHSQHGFPVRFNKTP
jgi:hypothetical protein